MAKMTKAQAKRSITMIQTKAQKLFLQDKGIDTKDYIAIEKICIRAFKRIK